MLLKQIKDIILFTQQLSQKMIKEALWESDLSGESVVIYELN